MKYIVIETPIGEIGFTFNNFINHSDFSECMIHLLAMQCKLNFTKLKTVSGGFVDSRGNCFGESESLKLKSRDTDSFIISK